MPSIGWTPRIVPYRADQTVYLVIDRFRGGHRLPRDRGRAGRPRNHYRRPDVRPIQRSDPRWRLQYAEHWSEDVTEYIAFEIQTHCDIEGTTVPEHIRDFVTSYAGPDRRPTLRLV
jgi:hypothetical protein